MKKNPIILIAILLIVVGGIAYYTTSDHGHDDPAHAEHSDEHGHNEHEDGGHDDHGHDEHGHGEHEEGRTEIKDAVAAEAGVKIAKAGAATIHETLTLTGRIVTNRNTTAEVRARFTGIVQSVKVNWGDKVSKGQTLATIEANDSLRSYNVTSPVDGVVLTRNTNIGNVAGEAPLFTIADLSEVWAEFHVFPRDLGKVKEGQPVRVHTIDDAYKTQAPITLILPTADPLSQTVIAVVSVSNPDNAWRPGMTVEGDVLLSEQQVKLAVTEDAIQQMEEENVVFVKEGNAYEARPVKLGKRDGEMVEVLSGLKAGEEYVSEGSFIIKADIGKSEAGHDHAH